MITVFCVLRSGGDYRPEHVRRLQMQVKLHLGGAEFRCLSDVDVPDVQTLPLKHGWPGWWSKMEMFNPSIKGWMLYLDLDSSVIGDLGDIASVEGLTIMRDVYRPDGLQSSIMVLPQHVRHQVWRQWIERPAHWMHVYRRGGDQAFLERFWLDRANRFQDVLPGQIVSYKANIRKATNSRENGDGTIPEGARVVIFHGKPRPWDIGW
ncbi:hypothetical protein [Rhizobium arsenicireducens]